MPGFTTHYIGGILTLSDFQRCNLKKSISSHRYAYQLGLQGPDIFFYNLFDLLSKSHPPLGAIMHTKKTGLFIQNCLDTIKSSPKENQSILGAYLSGFLCHYCLDIQCHPYIYSRSGYSHSTLKNTKNLMNSMYYSNHLSLENIIDTLLFNSYSNCIPNDLTFEEIELRPRSIQIISELLSNSIEVTYSITASPRLIRQIIHSFYVEHRCLSSLKNKRTWIQRMELKYLGCPLLSSMIPSDSHEDSMDALNIRSSTWYSPWQPNVAKNDTFIALFQHGIKRCTNLLDALNSYLLSLGDSFVHSKDQCILYKQFVNMVGNISYHSGLLLL